MIIILITPIIIIIIIIMIIINNALFQLCRYLRDAPGEHIYLPKRTGIFSVKIVGCFGITKIRLGEISSRKKV